jgi:uncharacterized protein (DUF433 family)
MPNDWKGMVNLMSELKKEELLQRITSNPKVMLGKPTVRGFRITVEHLLEALAAGVTQEDLIKDYPFLEPEDFQAALLYAKDLVEQERVIDVG